ncbi:MAG: methylmalonyl-CoA/ethylmalonyl-CoA epimerase [Chloroflexota bacterium]|jgi:methylmalonyl-CoA/ethylmalonyl-CoA epimerase|nr:methylmalonyl-CoA/ethylmalonyl-CoA epimerase [Chloroflexota bacterium]
MLQKIDHIGVAVPDIEAAIETYTQLFGVGPSHREVVESDGVETVMFEVGESRIELLGAIGPDSRIAGFLAKRGSGIHHVAYGVEDVQGSLDALAAQGMQLLDTRPRKGAGGKLVGFVHPKAVGGVLTELCQDDPAAAAPGG